MRGNFNGKFDGYNNNIQSIYLGHLLQTGNYVKASYNLDNASRIEKWSQEI